MEYIGNERLKELKPHKKSNKWLFIILIVLCICCVVIFGICNMKKLSGNKGNDSLRNATDIGSIDSYQGNPYVVINSNQPQFLEAEKNTVSFETYSDLDDLGRCGVAFANVSIELMPTEDRGEIGSVKPSGWHTVKYNDLIEGNYLYNRCHLIAYCLAGENANEKNLITGTRYLNVAGMLPFEIKVAEYVEQTSNHVLYRVTPVYEGDNLIASGVQIEAWSVEDNGAGICFNVYCYNVQPGIEIDYKTGDSWRKEDGDK